MAGRFYYRPLDQVLRRLGDNPLKSQPAHLIHFSIIRETAIEGRHTHYRYFSYRWHHKLVEAGLGQAMGGYKKTHTKNKIGPLEEPVASPNRITIPIDGMGFSWVDKRKLLKSDGSSTLAEAQSKLTQPESENILKSNYEIVTTADGRSCKCIYGSCSAFKLLLTSSITAVEWRNSRLLSEQCLITHTLTILQLTVPKGKP